MCWLCRPGHSPPHCRIDSSACLPAFAALVMPLHCCEHAGKLDAPALQVEGNLQVKGHSNW